MKYTRGLTALFLLGIFVGCDGGSTTGTGGTSSSTSETTGSGGSTAGAGGVTGGSTGTSSTTSGTGASGGSGGATTSSTGSGGTTTSSTQMCDPTMPTSCPEGQGCICGGPGAMLICSCGKLCTQDSECTDPEKNVCCGVTDGKPGICTDSCTCFCD
ncbi:MAG: hypothetical protein IPK82_16520 [Polyangiaceae bacterium]|nr:hypothetical protein [Polyangiaceae bacterium]